MSEKIRMLCGVEQFKSNSARHKKNCMGCKTAKALNEKLKKKEKIHSILLRLTDILKKNKIPLENDILQEILQLSDPSLQSKNRGTERKVEKTEGFIYLLQDRESIRMNDNVFKVGKCEDIVNRFKKYPKGSKLLKYIQVSNRHVSEGLLLKMMRDRHEVAKSYGNEYFYGDLNAIVSTFLSMKDLS